MKFAFAIEVVIEAPESLQALKVMQELCNTMELTSTAGVLEASIKTGPIQLWPPPEVPNRGIL